VVNSRKQRTPTLTAEEVTKIVTAAQAEMRTLFVLAAASGLRAGELLGLEIRHFDGRSITVEQSVWRSDAQAPKTQNAYRIVDLHPDVTKLLSDFVSDRKSGYIFCTSKGKPLGQSNILRRSLHPILEAVPKIEAEWRSQVLQPSMICLPVSTSFHVVPDRLRVGVSVIEFFENAEERIS
jgi:integrase